MKNHLDELIRRIPCLSPLSNDLEKSLNLLAASYHAGGKIITLGNGGSAADAEHMVAELMKGFLLRRPLLPEEKALLQDGGCSASMVESLQRPIPAISLVAGVALPTAFANDVDASLGFAQQVLGLGRKEDCLVAISTSGNSANVVHACHVAKALDIPILALTGERACKLDCLATVSLKAPSASTPIIQEYHIAIYHALCAALEARLFGEDAG